MSRLFRFDPMWESHPLRDRYDVVVIGAGVHGLATAYYLARRGITDVAVLEKGYLGSGNSGRNTAILRANSGPRKPFPSTPRAWPSTRNSPTTWTTTCCFRSRGT